MSIRVVTKPLEPNIPGQAQMRIKGWGDAVTGLEFKVQRNQDMGYLNGAKGEWSNSDYWFKLASVEQDNEELLIIIGADLLDPLLDNINAAYNVSMRNDAGYEDSGRLKIDPKLLPSTALGGSKTHQASGALTSPVVTQPIHESTPPVTPEPESEPPFTLEPEALAPELTPVELMPALQPEQNAAQPVKTNKKSTGKTKIMLIVLSLLLLLILAGAAWWFFQKKTAIPNPTSADALSSSAAASSNAIESPSRDGVCSLASMEREDELIFIQNCIQESNDSNALLAVIQQAKANNHCGIAQRLYANRAQSGDTVIALAYAKEYDPKFFAANNCFKEANSETAVYWYETVLLNESDNVEAAQRLEELAL